jgi:hypothetical protein
MAYLLIAGLPGAGKSYFCRWLQDEAGYVFVETDRVVQTDGAVRQLLSSDTLNVSWAASDFISRGADVVVEWGFIPELLGKVRQLVRSGFEPWWFGGDEMAARQAFMERGTVPEAAMKTQLAAIHEAWDRIVTVFAGHDLSTVELVGGGYRHLPPSEIMDLMEERRGRG